MTSWESSPGSGKPRAGRSTPEDIEVVKRSRALRHDLQIQAIVDRMERIEQSETPGTVRYAWAHWKEANSLLWRAVRRWFSVIPCRMHWHAPLPEHDYSTGLKVCRRCGAWREQRYL